MSNRRNGGIIGPQNRTAFSSAPGVWHLDDAQESSGAKNWPGGPASPYTITYLSVAGGGGGGYNDAGGGGGGGFLTNSYTATPGTTYTITVGSGGSGSAQTGNNSSSGSVGSNSSISGSGLTTVTSVGGGGGAALTNAAVSGGSGGGGSYQYAGASGTALQGNSGGSGGNISNQLYIGGGGGGAGASGNSATTTPGFGGDGLSSSITGSSVFYAGGGGGGGDNRLTTASFFFNATSDYLTYTDTASSFGTGNFTIEFWARLSNSSSNFIFNSTSTLNWGIVIYLNNVYWQYNGGNVLNTSSTLTLNSWNHIAVVRNGTTLTIYINGVSGASATDTTNYPTPSGQKNIGPANGGVASYYMSNLRIVKGTAVYTANFTPPTSVLPIITNTTLLTCLGTGFFDASTNNFALSLSGSPALNSLSPFTASRANISGAVGGSGGGGAGGGGANGNATTGSVNTGGGGGGGAVTSNIAAAGGSGVVILTMPTINYSGAVTGSPVVTTSGANTVVQFNGNGTYVA